MSYIFNLKDLISEDYLSLIRDKFKKDTRWGGAVLDSRIEFLKLITCLGDFKTILDYGAGNSKFKKDWFKKYPDSDIEIFEFEPGREDLSVEPPRCDITICYDVLEHVETDKIPATLKLIAEKTNKVFYFSICKIDALETFENGLNLHITVEDENFWLPLIKEYFDIYDLKISKGHLWGVGIKKQYK